MTIPDLPDDAQVTYTVRELLRDIKDQQTAGFSRVELSLEAKADKADVARMEVRLDNHAERLGSLEQERRDNKLMSETAREHSSRRWTMRSKILYSLGTIGMICATVLGPYIGAHLL